MRLAYKFAAPLFVAVVVPGVALAQDDSALARQGLFARDQNVSVRQRPKPEYTASPIPLGGLAFTPSVTAGFEYNDNIYATSTSATSDEVFRVQPSAVLASNWNRHAVSVYARASINKYVDNDSESTTDYQIGANARLDVKRDLGFSAGASFERNTEPRTASGSPGGALEPVRYDLASAFFESIKQFNRLRLTARADIRDFDYDNARSTTGGTIFEDNRDHSIGSVAFKGEYAISPSTSVFASIVANDRQFRNQRPILDTPRDSSGYELTVGLNTDVSHLVRGEFYIGYLEQNYENSRYGDVSGLAFRGQLEYFPTQLTTITAAVSRSVEDAAIVGASGYLSSNLSLQVDHELKRNVVLTGAFTYGTDDYKGIDRNDDRFSETLSATYLLNRTTGLNLSYVHYNQNSHGTGSGPNFDVNRILGSVIFQF